MSGFCYCPSGNKSWLLAARANNRQLQDACNNFGNGLLATELESQDYKALGMCIPPVMEQYYSIGLNLLNENRRNKTCNASHPYVWNDGDDENDQRCVNGQPLMLPNSFPNDNLCHVASIKPGSLDLINNASWTRCNSLQSLICQVDSVNSSITFCKNVSTTTIETKQTSSSMSTTTTATTPATAITSNNSTPVIVGSISGVSLILLFLLLLFIFYKRVKTKRNASNNENQEKVYCK